MDVVRAAVLANVARDGRAARNIDPGRVVYTATKAVEDRLVVNIVAGDGAAVHVEQGVIRHARAEACRIAGDRAVPHREPAGVDAHAVARLATFVGDFARGVTGVAIGDDELSAGDRDGAVSVGAGDGVAVKAEIYGVAKVDIPRGGKRDVLREVVVRVAGLFAGQAIGLIPGRPLELGVLLGVGAV